MARRDPLAFMRWFCYTCDQHDSENPVKRFCWDLEYIQRLTRLWQANRCLSVLKARQMRCTWLFVILSLWDAMFHRGRLIMLQSKREDDAIGDANAGDGLLGRAKFIMNHLPWRKQLIMAADDGSVNYAAQHKMIRFYANNSTLWAIPQGAAIIRQRTASGILSDESAFQPESGDAYTAARPCIRGGGWYVSLTTPDMADGGHTRRLHEDRLDAA